MAEKSEIFCNKCQICFEYNPLSIHSCIELEVKEEISEFYENATCDDPLYINKSQAQIGFDKVFNVPYEKYEPLSWFENEVLARTLILLPTGNRFPSFLSMQSPRYIQ